LQDEKSTLNSLAHKIASKKNLASICFACNELFSTVMRRNAKDLVLDTKNGKEIKEKCQLLKELLEQNGIAENFSDEDLCKLAHKVFEIKLLRGV